MLSYIFLCWFFFFSIYMSWYDFVIFVEYSLYNCNSFSLSYLIYLDCVSMVFISVVLLISSIVIYYSFFYMGEYSYSFVRFLFIVLMFIFSMFLMVVSPNLLSIMLGWDGLGLVSYCLVIYYSSMKSYISGMITCLTNRIGDFGLLICSCWLFSYGSWHFLFYLDLYNLYVYYFLVFSCFTKSAQVPFSSWLPMAMAAPTPVSSLVHSSTLVTAGVYLLIRFYSSLFYFNFYFIFLGLLTILISSFSANYEYDIKSIIALSTLSQLGFMVVTLMLGFPGFSFFHLISHAMFKSLMFLCSGIFIFYMNDNQDIRYLGSVCMLMPFSSSCFNISNICLCGIPFLSGFYSKDIIFESFSFSSYGFFFYFFFYLSIGMTSIYSFRLFYYSFFHFNICNCFMFFFDSLNEMTLSLFFLSFCSIFFGFLIFCFFDFNLSFIYLPFGFKMLTILLVFFGVLIGYELVLFSNYLLSFFFYYSFGNIFYMSGYYWFFYYYLYIHLRDYNNYLLMWGEFYGVEGIFILIKKLNTLFYFYFLNKFSVFMFIWFFFFFIFI